MSGALIDLVSKGVQDVYLTGEPQVSFFRQNYKRHTNFSMKPVELNPIGVQQAGNEIVLPIERKGDLLTYVWCDATSGPATSNIITSNVNPTEFSLHIGGVEIDRQDAWYSANLWPKFMTTTSSKTLWPGDKGVFPMHFFHCDSQTTPLPLVAMQYHNAEIKVKHSSDASDPSTIKYYACYVMLDTDERKFFTENRQEMLVTQVQKVGASVTGCDLMYLNHPVKALMWGNEDDTVFPDCLKDVQLRINGTSVFDTPMPGKFFSTIQKYHHTKATDYTVDNNYMYSFATCPGEHQPTGSCNFSRLDNARLSWSMTKSPTSVYAVNYNILVVDQGLTGLKFSN
tara:strand:- start:3106 stop:4128 length:1023 start_codon:yes stop_codon:yes gene_type:complete